MRIRTLPQEVLLNAVQATGAGEEMADHGTQAKRVFQAYLAATTTPAATVLVEVRGTADAPWGTLATFTLSGSGDTAIFSSDAPWKFVRGNVSAISGTDAAVTLTMGV